MMPHWTALLETERPAYRAARTFLEGRMSQLSTIAWALDFSRTDQIKKAAVLDILESIESSKIGEPWLSAWLLIEEMWTNSSEDDQRSSSEAYRIRERVRKGDRSGGLLARIVSLVSPKLDLRLASQAKSKQKKCKVVSDVFSITFTSHGTIYPFDLGLETIVDENFLVDLANRFEAALDFAISTSRRFGWGAHEAWRLGQLHRVYYVPAASRPPDEDEPDKYYRGVATLIKQLYFVVSRLKELNSSEVLRHAQRWRRADSFVHNRLWAAIARDPNIATADEVSSFLLSLGEDEFWDHNGSPEFAELRAVRFADLSHSNQELLLKRLRARPPRKRWPTKVDVAAIEDARSYWVAREFRRLEICGYRLPAKDKVWLSSNISKWPDLAEMTQVYDGFLGGTTVRWLANTADTIYDGLLGSERLAALESALCTDRRGWNDDPAEKAGAWIAADGNPLKVISDFEAGPEWVSRYPNVWNRFGWTHSPSTKDEDKGLRDVSSEAQRVASLLVRLSDESLELCIEGISNWISTWEDQVIALSIDSAIWEKAWPLAVEATNKKSSENKLDQPTAESPNESDRPTDLDALNVPSGKLVGVMLRRCKKFEHGENPFHRDAALGRMRDTVIEASGRAGLIVRHRLLEHLPYFLAADKTWTMEHLIRPLLSDNNDALSLWRAVARQTRFYRVLRIIGNEMAVRAMDARLDRRSRESLVFSLIVECLHSLREKRPPAVVFATVQQMIRSLDDEVRSRGAEALQSFIHELSGRQTKSKKTPTPEELFETAVRPFLQQVWPQEKSLSTPGTSRAFSDLPATSRNAFADAVRAVERFLVPFDCWSMLEFGLYGDEEGQQKLSCIDDPEKASALLTLLNRTVGETEASVVPMDLGDALAQVRKVAPALAETVAFRRLATAARRA